MEIGGEKAADYAEGAGSWGEEVRQGDSWSIPHLTLIPAPLKTLEVEEAAPPAPEPNPVSCLPHDPHPVP